MIEIEIDGKKITVEEGATIIEAADQMGVYIPRFCYHKKLSIAANCRMCLVEVEKAPKAVPACATPVTANMKVFTTSEKTLEAQRKVMEFLLINHPLDCPICDQGGACELQDLAMGFGSPYSYYEEGKRSFFNDNLGPLIATEMTRCIQCTRCVRFGEEIAGQRELGVVARGEKERITTYIKTFVKSELSGNVIDICPVGALTAKPSRFAMRDWEMREHPMISPHDCVGSNTYMHSAFREYEAQTPVLRTVARENEAINETWISDRDRFSYEGLYHMDRVYQPKIKHNGEWQDSDWQSALQQTAHHIQQILQQHGNEQIAALMSSNATVEEFYLLQKLMRELGSNHIDHRVRECDFSDQDNFAAFPGLSMSIPEIQQCDCLLLIGSNVRHEQPLISHHIFQAFLEQAKVMVINPVDYEFPYVPSHGLIHTDVVSSLAQLVKACAEAAGKSIAAVQHVTVSDTAKQMATQLKSSEKIAIFLGNFAMQHPHAATLRQLASYLAELTGAQLNFLTDGANGAGAWLVGAVPHRNLEAAKLPNAGRDAKTLLTQKPVKIYILFNLEPELDSAYPAAALATLQQADLVICLTTFATPQMQHYADVILPVAPFTETQGTYVNAEGKWQEFNPCSVPMGAAKPGWKIISALANFLGLPNFQFDTITQVRIELKAQIQSEKQVGYVHSDIQALPTVSSGIYRLAPWHMYSVDPLVRRAEALQATLEDDVFGVEMSSLLAKKLGFSSGERVLAKQGDKQVALPVFINDRIADNAVILRSGLEQTSGFGDTTAMIELEKESL